MSSPTLIEQIRGVRVETGANRPFPMDDPEQIHFVERGRLDVFAVEFGGDEAAGRRRFVARVPAGEMALGAVRVELPSRPGRAVGLLAVPSQDAVLVEGVRAGIAAENFDLAATSWIDEWIARLSEFLVRQTSPPREALLLEADPDVPYPAGTVLAAQHRDVVWVSATQAMRLVGRADLTVREGEPLVPVTERTWVAIDADADVSCVYTPTALVTDRLWSGVDRFGVRVLEFAVLADAEDTRSTQSRRRDARAARRASISKALRGFGEALGTSGGDDPADATGRSQLERAACLVAASNGASLEFPAAGPGGSRDSAEDIEALARRSGLHTRRIALAPDWWRRDGPSFLGFTSRKGKPVALLSNQRGAYRAVNPDTGASFAVTGRTAAGIASAGTVFYAALPDRVESVRTALDFSLHRRGRDLRTLFTVGALGGLTALLVPILTGEILVNILPRSNTPLWLAALGALLLVAVGGAVFEFVRGLAMLRVEGRVDERLQSAIWSRLISLPAPFFREFAVGDLADRANGIAQVRQILTGAAVQAALGGIFSIFSLALLFFYSWPLALCVCALLVVLVAITWILSRGQLRHHRAAFRAQGQINGFVFQMISGIAKIRVANAESYALARWAERYADQTRSMFAALRWGAGQYVLVGVFQPLALIAVFAVVHYGLAQGEGPATLDLASFLSFNAAFGQLTAAVIGLTSAATTVMGVIPLLERVRPILDTVPETARGGTDPGDLRGDIEFVNVKFRYDSESPYVIDGMSFRIRQGDYVAFVGASGSGKSTIYRLLLGFERPTSGTVFLDGHDLQGLNAVAVRNRMGVVLQNGEVIAGSVYENIAGMSPMSADDAWEAARVAALEHDIRAMPMGMRTMLPEGGVGLSVGQKQRLLIARATARKPRILLFDEATSSLDNRAQAVVQASLRRVGITRVVIAHRLSSIRDVDRIYVLDDGRIVESGRYEQLMQQDGVFASLARRQLA